MGVGLPLEAIEPRRLYRQIADQLRQLIDDGEYPVGSRLPTERELAEQLGVSRPTVREALIALEVEGRLRSASAPASTSSSSSRRRRRRRQCADRGPLRGPARARFRRKRGRRRGGAPGDAEDIARLDARSGRGRARAAQASTVRWRWTAASIPPSPRRSAMSCWCARRRAVRPAHQSLFRAACAAHRRTDFTQLRRMRSMWRSAMPSRRATRRGARPPCTSI